MGVVGSPTGFAAVNNANNGLPVECQGQRLTNALVHKRRSLIFWQHHQYLVTGDGNIDGGLWRFLQLADQGWIDARQHIKLSGQVAV